MRSELAALAALLAALLAPCITFAQYRRAVPGHHFEFPRDHFNHPDFQTEWWYYTGNLKSSGGRHYGFELTFFRQGVNRDAGESSVWSVRDVYLAHFALSDLDGQSFYHEERTNRAGPGIAGVTESDARIWNGNWQVQFNGENQQLEAIGREMQLSLALHAQKPPVIHGENGVSQKSGAAGRASYYVSLTRLLCRGKLRLHGEEFAVEGLAWMDHEFFTDQLEANQAGWDWLSLQLDDNTELMLFRLRRKDGSTDAFSAGTYIDARGKSTHLTEDEFTLEPLRVSWSSPASHATYPIGWKLKVPRLGLELETSTPLAAQELTSSASFVPTYWEGAISAAGRRGNAALSGLGYLEMTGYDRAVTLTR